MQDYILKAYVTKYSANGGRYIFLASAHKAEQMRFQGELMVVHDIAAIKGMGKEDLELPNPFHYNELADYYNDAEELVEKEVNALELFFKAKVLMQMEVECNTHVGYSIKDSESAMHGIDAEEVDIFMILSYVRHEYEKEFTSVLRDTVSPKLNALCKMIDKFHMPGRR